MHQQNDDIAAARTGPIPARADRTAVRDRSSNDANDVVESDGRFRSIFDQAAVGVAELDHEARFLRINDRLCESLGYSRRELLGLHANAITHPDDVGRGLKNAEELAQGARTHFTIETRYRRRNGSFMWARLTVSVVRGEDGEFQHFVSIIEDISAAKATEEALRHSEARLRSVVEALSEGLVIADLDGQILHWNRAALQMHGFADVEEVNQHLSEFTKIFALTKLDGVPVPYDEWPVLRILRNETLVDLKLRISRTDRPGWNRIFSFGGTIVRDANDRPIAAMLTITDDTDRQHAEQRLREGEERFRALVDVSSQIVWTTTADGTMIDGSKSWMDFTGQSDADLSDSGWLLALHPDDRAQAERVWKEAVASRRAYQNEYRLRNAAGEWRWTLVRGVPMLNPDGSVRSWVGMNSDITDRKDAEISLQRAKESAEAASRAKDQLMAVVSHELRTPLTPVLAAASQMSRRKDLPPALREDVEMIRRNVELEARLVDDLLSLTRLTRGKIMLHQETVDAHAVVRSLVAQFQPEIDAKRIELTVGLRAEEPFVWADPTRLQQVLTNLLGNAVKFTPTGGSIAVRTSLSDGMFRISVSDSGIGVEPEMMARLFNPFEQGERTVTRKHGGLGLGLSIARQLVELHGGRLTATSAGKDKGATFTVELSAAPSLHKSDDAPAEPEAPAEGEIVATVLLVDDHHDTLRTMAKLLQQLGYATETAGSVAEALEKGQTQKYDLLLSDIGLPDGNGNDVARELHNRGAIRAAVALSGFGQPEDVQRSREAGFVEHLVKPIDIDLLSAALTRALKAGRN